MKLLCKFIGSQDYVCDEVEIVLIEIYYKQIIDRILSNTTCEELSLCKYPLFLEDDPILFKKNILKYTPPNTYKKQFRKNKIYKIGVITDLHLDLNYTEGKRINCNHILCCQK